jgi:hypothetical protein
VYCGDSAAAAEVEAVADTKADADIEVDLGEDLDPALDVDAAADRVAETDVEGGPDGDTTVDVGRDREADSAAEERRCGVAGSILDTFITIRTGDDGTGVLDHKLEGGGSSVCELGLDVGAEAGA